MSRKSRTGRLAYSELGSQSPAAQWRGVALGWSAFAAAVAALGIWLVVAGPPDRDIDVASPVVVALRLGVAAVPPHVAAVPPEPDVEPSYNAEPTADEPAAAVAPATPPSEPSANIAPLAPVSVAPVPAPVPAPAPATAPAPVALAPSVALAPPAPPPVPTPAPAQRGPVALIPEPAITAPGSRGPLPVIAPDLRQAWQVYARPFEAAAQRPRVAVVIGDLGLSAQATQRAIDVLPGAITFAFAPLAARLQYWIDRARAAGHEVLLQVPMEPQDYPASDPGPQALLTSLSAAENLARLEAVLSRATGYAGTTNYMGSKFTASVDDIRPILGSLKSRGLLFLDSRASPRSVAAQLARELDMPYAVNSRYIDNDATPAAIEMRLQELERVARSSGWAVGMGYPYPATIDRVAAWAKEAESRGIALAPVSAVTRRQSDE